MIDIIKALDANEKEAINILKGQKDNTIVFGVWDDDTEEYSNGDDCPWIRYASVNGDIEALLVVGVKYNDEKNRIEIIASDGVNKTDDKWFPLNFADDISYWSVFEHIGEFDYYLKK